MQTKIIIISVIVLLIIGTLTGIYVDLKLDMNQLEKEKSELKEANSSLHQQLAVERLNVVKLKSTITKVNNDLEKISIKNTTIEKELERWKNGVVNVTNRNEKIDSLLDAKLYIVPDCQNGLFINKLLSEIKYEDL